MVSLLGLVCVYLLVRTLDLLIEVQVLQHYREEEEDGRQSAQEAYPDSQQLEVEAQTQDHADWGAKALLGYHEGLHHVYLLADSLGHASQYAL